MQATASKAAANVLRIAGVLATMEQSAALEEDHILRASTLMNYYLTEIQRLTEREGLHEILQDADRLRRWLLKKQPPPFSMRDLMRNGPRFVRKNTEYTSALMSVLIEYRWVDSDKGELFEVSDVSPQ